MRLHDLAIITYKMMSNHLYIADGRGINQPISIKLHNNFFGDHVLDLHIFLYISSFRTFFCGNSTTFCSARKQATLLCTRSRAKDFCKTAHISPFVYFIGLMHTVELVIVHPSCMYASSLQQFSKKKIANYNINSPS